VPAWNFQLFRLNERCRQIQQQKTDQRTTDRTHNQPVYFIANQNGIRTDQTFRKTECPASWHCFQPRAEAQVTDKVPRPEPSEPRPNTSPPTDARMTFRAGKRKDSGSPSTGAAPPVRMAPDPSGKSRITGPGGKGDRKMPIRSKSRDPFALLRCCLQNRPIRTEHDGRRM
jgi:hypothetical protein